MSKPTPNAADESKLAEQKQKDKFKREMEIADLKAILTTPHGRRFFWRVLGYTGPLRQTFDHSGSVTGFNEGRRSVGLWLWSEMESAMPEAYIAMLAEAREQEDA